MLFLKLFWMKNRLFFGKNAQNFMFNLLFSAFCTKNRVKCWFFCAFLRVDKRKFLWYNCRTASAGSGPFGRTNSHMANFASCLTFKFRSARIPKSRSYGLDSCLFWFLLTDRQDGTPAICSNSLFVLFFYPSKISHEKFNRSTNSFHLSAKLMW